jgi:non-homologous end joining protein Ku
VAPRAYWKGYLKLLLVSCPVALFPASSEREKIGFNQINKNTGNRIRYFEPEEFEDQYEDALKELLKKKQAGEKIEAPKERAPAKVINLMDALRRSVEAERGGSAKRQAPPAKARGSESERPKKKKRVS